MKLFLSLQSTEKQTIKRMQFQQKLYTFTEIHAERGNKITPVITEDSHL